MLSKFPKDKVKQVFIDSEQERMNYLEQQSRAEDYSIESIVQVVVFKTMLSDSIFERWGIEEEELQGAVIFYNLIEDEDIIKMVKKRVTTQGDEGEEAQDE